MNRITKGNFVLLLLGTMLLVLALSACGSSSQYNADQRTAELPTKCVTLLTTDSETEHCFAPTTPFPPQYANLHSSLIHEVVEEEEAQAERERTKSSEPANPELFHIVIDLVEGSTGSAIKEWLDANSHQYEYDSDPGQIYTFVPASHLLALSQLEGVQMVRLSTLPGF